MLKLIAPNGDVLFHLEGKAEQEESAEIFKFPETLLQEQAWTATPRPNGIILDERVGNAFWRRQPTNAALTAHLENLQREMDRVLTNPNVFTRLADQQIFTALQERTRARERALVEDGRQILLRDEDMAREYADQLDAQETEEQEG
jgi:hypothetical protein